MVFLAPLIRSLLQMASGWLVLHGVESSDAAQFANAAQPILIGLLGWGGSLVWSYIEKSRRG